MIRFVAASLLFAAVHIAPVAAQTEVEPAGPPAAATGGPNESQVVAPSDVESGKPVVPSFQRGSATRAGGPANELNTSDGRAKETLPDGSVAAAAGGGIYHGNHCGLGKERADQPPADELDATCLRHDQCAEAAGRASCACDRALRREALIVSTNGRFSRELRARALSVAQAAELMVCTDP